MPHPKRLLNDILWSCTKTRYPDQAAFSDEVRQYHLDIRGNDAAWRPGERVLESPEVRIYYMHWTTEDEQEDGCVSLKAADGRGFTMLELFHGFVDGMAAQLIEGGGELYDHKFFEGLGLYEVDGAGAPVYVVRFGS